MFHRSLGRILRLFLVFPFILAACAPVATPAPTASTIPAATETNVPVATEAATAEPTSTPPAAEPAFPLTVTDAIGQEFTFDAPPKLGCWWAGCTEMLADLGIPAHAGAYDDTNAKSVFFYPAGTPAENITDTQNPELWAAAEVELLLLRVPNDPSRDPLKEAAPIFYLHHPSYGESSENGYQAFIENMHLMGRLTGKTEAADAAIARFTNAMENLKALSTPETKAQKVAVLFQGDGYTMIGPGNPFCVALNEVGLGQCVGEGSASYELNAEEFLSLDPDWLVYQFGEGSYKDRKDPVWPQLTAVKEGRVYDAQNHRYYCCSLRGLIMALQEFAHYSVPSANIPAPGFWLDFDPLKSPLIQPTKADAPASGMRTVKHDLGTVEVPINPQRIVAINSAAIELLAALKIKPVGIAPWIGAGNAAKVPPHISAAMDLTGVEFVGDANQPNLEAIAAVKPDLILMSGGGYYKELYEQVNQIAPTVAYAAWPKDSPRSYWKEYFVSTAAALGKEKEAQAVIDTWEARVAKFNAEAAVDTTRLSVIRLMPAEIMAYKKGSYSGTVLTAAGVKQIESQEEIAFAQTISMEELPNHNGDIILLIQSDPNAAIYNQLLASPLWQQLGAVKAGKVYLVNHDIWIGGDGYISANLILDDLEKLLLQNGAGLKKAE